MIQIYHKIFKGDETLFIIDDCSVTKELKYRKHENNSVLNDFREQLKWLCLLYCKDRNSFENCLRENDVVPDEETRKAICLKLNIQN